MNPDLDIKILDTKQYKIRDTASILFSTPAGSHPEKVRAAVRNTAKAYFGDQGFRYVFGLHTDTAKPHVHISIKTYNEVTGKTHYQPQRYSANAVTICEESKRAGHRDGRIHDL